MNKPIIEVKNLSKKYTLGERQPYYSFRDTISGILKSPFRKDKLKPDEFWALKDVSFDVNEGDVVGIIGRNGAGKSTLLKILSQITPPTEGEVTLGGRVASLLEVGTGFHPELTGKENIYLNGAILGMKRWEINNKFKDIVNFAEIEKFIDTPVKHYSSGMYMRLAFAVAAHLEPEILLVDEVLAVGDIQFQKKCLRKMGEVARNGRTIIFVSHDISAIRQLTERCQLYENGKLIEYSNTKNTLATYLDNERPGVKGPKLFRKVRINSVIVTDEKNKEQSTFDIDQNDIVVKINLAILQEIKGCSFGIDLVNTQQGHVYTTSTSDTRIDNFQDIIWSPGEYIFTVKLTTKYLRSGNYELNINGVIHNREIIYSLENCASFSILSNTEPDTILRENRKGVISPIINWKISKNT
jgi:lipopolysaccharide transport system ATP-binding protein